MNMRKKLLSLLLAVCLVAGLLPAAALASEEAPAPAETPIAEETPAAEETPIEEETPAVEETPVAEETPAAEEAPAEDGALIEEEAPAEEETPVEEEAPAEEETPVEDGAPADDADADGYHDGDVAAVKAIIGKNSGLADAGVSAEDISTWSFATWTETDGVNRLTELDLYGADVSDLSDITALTALTYLDCSATGVSALDVSHLTELEYLYCYSTGITALDVSNNTKLLSLDCSTTGVSALDVSANPLLHFLSMEHSNITELDVSGLADLTNVYFGSRAAGENTLKTALGTVTIDQPAGGTVYVLVNIQSALVSVYVSLDDDYELTAFTGLPEGAVVDMESPMAEFAMTGDVTLSAELDRPDYNAEEVVVLLDLLERSGMDETYDPEAPDSWDFVNWQEIGGEYRVTDLYLYNWTGLSGALDVSALSELRYLDCCMTGITALDVSGLSALEELVVSYTDITALDVSTNTALKWLDVSDTNIAELDVTMLPALEWLDVSDTGLAALDLSGNPNLITLGIEGSGISEFDATGFAHMEDVRFGGSGAEEDVLKTDRGTITLKKTPGGSIRMHADLANDTGSLSVYPKQGFHPVEWTGLPQDAELMGGQVLEFGWTEGDLTIAVSFKDRDRSEAELAFIRELLERSGKDGEYDLEVPGSWDFVIWEEFDGVWRVTGLSLYEWTGLTGELDTAALEMLIYLDCGYTGITELDVSENTLLMDLDVSGTGITALDVTELSELVQLDADDIPITELDVSKNPWLEALDVSGTKLTRLDVTHNPVLADLDADNIPITELDVSKNPLLEDLQFCDTGIAGKDMSGYEELDHLGFGSSCARENVSRIGDATLTLLQSEGGTIYLYVGRSYSYGWLEWETEEGYELVSVSGMPEDAVLIGPEGYQLYEFDWDGGDLTISAEFKKTETPAPEATAAPEKPDVPNTGDESPLALWALVLLACGAGAVTLVRRKKEN